MAAAICGHSLPRPCSSPGASNSSSSSVGWHPQQHAADWQQRRQWQQRQWRRPPPALLPPPAAAADPGYETDNDGQTVEQRLAMVQNMVATSELLVPYDRSAVNLGLILWGAIRNIPHADRMQLLSRIGSGDIKRLWKVAGQRFNAPKQQVAAAIGPDYSILHDLPSEVGQLSLLRGKAALPIDALGFSSFGKALFRHPQRTGELYGRVLLGKGPIGDWLYPLYFKAHVGTTVVPTTQEPCDMVLRYLPPEDIGLGKSDLPRNMWPAPGRQLPPFNEGFTDYVRAVAPGVYVGLGYRTAATEANDPIYFLMVLDRKESA